MGSDNSIQRWHSGPARQWLELHQLKLLKDQYSDSLSLPVSGSKPLIPWNSPRENSPWLGSPAVGHITEQLDWCTDWRVETSLLPFHWDAAIFIASIISHFQATVAPNYKLFRRIKHSACKYRTTRFLFITQKTCLNSCTLATKICLLVQSFGRTPLRYFPTCTHTGADSLFRAAAAAIPSARDRTAKFMFGICRRVW